MCIYNSVHYKVYNIRILHFIFSLYIQSQIQEYFNSYFVQNIPLQKNWYFISLTGACAQIFFLLLSMNWNFLKSSSLQFLFNIFFVCELYFFFISGLFFSIYFWLIKFIESFRNFFIKRYFCYLIFIDFHFVVYKEKHIILPRGLNVL